MVLKKLDRFIIKSFMGPMILTTLVVTFILVMHFLWLYIDELVGKGLGLGVIAEFLMWGCATLFPMVLPLATLLASIMTLGDFGENNELLAMKAAGISLQRILVPLIIIAFLISACAFFASNNLMPLAFKKIYSLRADIANTREEIKLPTGIFYNGIDNYSLRIQERNKETGTLYGIMLYDHSKNRGNVSVTLADSGSIRLTSDKKNIIVLMYSGYRYEEVEQASHADTSHAMQRVGFDEQQSIISLQDYNFKRSDDERFGDEIMAQNLKSLGHFRDSLDSSYVQVNEQFISRLFKSGHFRYQQQLDTAYNKHLHTLFPLDSIKPYQNDPQEYNALEEVTRNIDAQLVILDSYAFQSAQYSVPLRRTSLEWYRKFMLSLACIIFFFIGAPLGAIIRKGGIGMPTIISIFFFLIYWVIDISGKKLATDGVISPAIGAMISSIVLLPMGIFLTWKATTDSSLFNADAYISTIKRIASTILKPFKKHEPST